MKKLNVTAFALSCGMTWGIFVLLLAILAMLSGMGKEFIDLLGSVYIGLEASVTGAFIGLLWAFADGFIGALIFVLLYNYFAPKFK